MTFEWPLVLLGLGLIPILLGLGLIPILLALYVLAQRRRSTYAVRFTNLALLSQVMGRGPGLRRHIPALLYLLGLAALLVSLARPSTVIAVPRDQTTVMLVMDVSGSMAANDLRPNRMVAAKQAARAFVQALPPTMQVGLISFSTNARVSAPLTRDHQAVLRAVDSLAASGGTAIGEGLNAALDQLAGRPVSGQTEPAPALVVVLSDGASTSGQSPMTAAARARADQVKVYTVGIGQRGASPLIDGRLPARLDEATLQDIAEETGGTYYYAAEAGQLERIYADLGSQVSWVEERTEITALVSALGTVFLMAGGLLGLLWLQRLP
jgi:Ca-activated chloride channel family protein